MAQREALAKTVKQQRDDLLEDVKLAGQVQRLFFSLPSGKPTIAGRDIAGMMLPLRGVGGDYYDYIPIDAHTTQVAIADVAGKGVPAALLMAATGGRFAGWKRIMIETCCSKWNGECRDRRGIGSRTVRDVAGRRNRHAKADRSLRELRPQSGASFRAKNGHADAHGLVLSTYWTVPDEICELASADLSSGDVLVFYTDGVTEAENRVAEEFGMERLFRGRCAMVFTYGRKS